MVPLLKAFAKGEVELGGCCVEPGQPCGFVGIAEIGGDDFAQNK